MIKVIRLIIEKESGSDKLMLNIVLLSNLRFIVHVFAGMIFAGMSWLYFDAMVMRRHKSIAFKAIGALVLSIAYILGSMTNENSNWFLNQYFNSIMIYGKCLGYSILAIGVWGESLSKKPQYNSFLVSVVPTWVLPILPAFVGLGYLRRASIGLERHLSKMGYGMYLLAIAEIFDLRKLFVNSTDLRIYEFVREFGFFWVTQLIILILGIVLISIWVFSYLLRRFETQITLFMGMLVLLVLAVSLSVFTVIMTREMVDVAKRETETGSLLVANILNSKGQSLLQKADEYSQVETEDKEKIAAEIKKSGLKMHLLNSSGVDFLSGEKFVGGVVDQSRVSYIKQGEGMAREISTRAVQKTSFGYVLIDDQIDFDELEDDSKLIRQGIRLIEGNHILAASSVPNFPRIANSAGLEIDKSEIVGGVEYVVASQPLKDYEGVGVGRIETIIPMQSLWLDIEQALASLYLLAIVTLMLLEIPAYLMARHITNQVN